ncbi:indole-3-glycerol phosphate synthase TrpC [Sulfolobus acidocaldarius]|uniref:Indole-3-glycerol phosphate synthase n=4 Tax=Sulfolobus acidocaldarius TaxID=2285 RepID=TRPC_SULAC|nr:indole-3-glycerol phosphate synthase TrpC [Sulfolobus acidocaldarius]Q4J8X3.1 RecName: Full=Indole-3-glycerol phosphate synthase; Short=IGPS [Sulfolobus acidocaldarius DSM 639]AAY80757.1 indole-3-glycerol phosphate synthase [Sulfolobus acidocaldarius DSM 639]AGE71353.1 indole-3-glycerol-phosphate synthase [Sulfolobus acidocaldarius N8]AGE73624.1 indole-3-glycerol-phosphate synthase [Sulfolobus acidocaldarius Ron12/I]ALU30395.1 indole-3-glycerol phosphate synthase [Sulfolobus acidocaldarius]
MPRFLNGWLTDVVQASLSRPKIEKVRDRPIFSLKKSIISAKNSGLNPIIAEYKRRSPSGINVDINIIEYVKFMENNGATGISVLTEEKFFNGSYNDLELVAKNVKLPILMKDFVVSEKQIDSAYNIGADVILLIAKILTERELVSLYKYAKSYGLEAIVEISDEEDLDVALRGNYDFIGVNARNLESLEVSLDRTKKLLQMIPKDRLKIAESGISTRQDIEELRASGADAFLIGTSLLKDQNKIKELI